MRLHGRPRRYHLDRPATNAERQWAFQHKRLAELCRLRQQLATRAYHRSQRHDWETPPEVFAAYDAEFHFTLDVCATAEHATCVRFFSPEQNGLMQDWGDEVCWMHPPYENQIAAWMEKAYRSSLAGATVVCLVPARTGTRWWHDWVLEKAEVQVEVRLRKGRMTFVGAPHPAGFDAVAVMYRP
jgi:phage N-6-adenine-methyltransferase